MRGRLRVYFFCTVTPDEGDSETQVYRMCMERMSEKVVGIGRGLDLPLEENSIGGTDGRGFNLYGCTSNNATGVCVLMYLFDR